MCVREQTLSTASTLPILKQPAGRTERFPNVYDSLAEAKQASAFVAGVKMALPASMERINNSKYEEINIPVSDPAPMTVGNRLVPISSLDPIGQRAFSNCKTLNRIQTVVFETAYRTNENMLICAPTGQIFEYLTRIFPKKYFHVQQVRVKRTSLC